MKILSLILLLFTLIACNKPRPKSKKELQAEKAKAMAESIKFSGNAEIENIKKRLELTSDPLLIGYIVLMNEAGQPILYTTIKGKVTSGGKSLTSKKRVNSDYYKDLVVDSPSDEGTYGSSGQYIFFTDMNGVYHQWSGAYLYSDKPLRLNVKPLVINIVENK